LRRELRSCPEIIGLYIFIWARRYNKIIENEKRKLRLMSEKGEENVSKEPAEGAYRDVGNGNK